MNRRILAPGLAAAALYAGASGAWATADEPMGGAATPTPTASAAATAIATPLATPASGTPTPAASTTATPAATATGTPTATATPTREQSLGVDVTKAARSPERANTQQGRAASCPTGKLVGTVQGASTSGRDCRSAKRTATPTPAPSRAPARAAAPAPGPAIASPGAAAIGVPDYFIDKFRIPPFLLPLYQAAGMQYGIRWEVLAAINEIETDYGRNVAVSSAGAVGWMQFMPATWAAYGVDANGDGEKDPLNPVDAIFAAARYLRAAGGDRDLRRAVFAYNHADWYVDSVLMRAQVIGGLPADLVGSLTGLTQGRFPVAAKATYGGARRDGIDIRSTPRARVIAVGDGRVTRMGTNRRLGRFVELQDVYGNTYTYGHLGDVAKTYPVARTRKVHAAPARPADHDGKRRLFANPGRPNARLAGGALQVRQAAAATPGAGAPAPLGLDPRDFVSKPLVKGARVIAGTILGRLGERTAAGGSYLRFEIRPAGADAPRIDPRPILDGWKLLESTAVYRAAGRNPLAGPDAETPSIGQILLMSKETLARRVLADARITIYDCGRADIAAGQLDRRVLATLEYLAASGLRPTVSSLRCGHGLMTASGNVSEHSTGTAVDISAINGIPIAGHQGAGSVTDAAIQRLLTLQGTMKPHQIISLMTFDGADNTLAMADHADHIHVGWRPQFGANHQAARQIDAILEPEQWTKLVDRLGSIDNPTVREQPSRFAVKVVKRAAKGRGE